MEKVDFKKSLACYRARRSHFEIIDVPEMQYLMIDGLGDPNSSPVFASAISALYPIAYCLKFASKNQRNRDYVMPPLEGLWWADDMDSFTRDRDKSRWHWTVMIMTPDWLDQSDLDSAKSTISAKHSDLDLSGVRLGTLAEGKCVQTLHVGSFDDEAPVLEEMHARFIPDNGLTMTGQHHEIYLSDFRRVESTKQRTILRQPVTD